MPSLKVLHFFLELIVDRLFAFSDKAMDVFYYLISQTLYKHTQNENIKF